MKRLFTTSAILLVTAVLAVGQDWYDDDIYYDASKAKKQKMESRKDVKKNPDIVVYNDDTMTFEAPTYFVDGIMHYAVDHTPSLFYKTFTENNSATIVPYINMLVNETPDDVLEGAVR